MDSGKFGGQVWAPMRGQRQMLDKHVGGRLTIFDNMKNRRAGWDIVRWRGAAVVPVVAGVLAGRRAGASRPAGRTHALRLVIENFQSLSKCGCPFRAAGRAPSTAGGTPAATTPSAGGSVKMRPAAPPR